MSNKRPRPMRHHTQFCLVEGPWLVLIMTVCLRGQWWWRCRMFQRVGDREQPVGHTLLFGSRVQAERWARRALAELQHERQREARHAN